MVHEHFGLQRMPFSSAPDTSLMVNVPTMMDVLQRTRVCIDSGSGAVIVIGQSGTGKSLLLEKLAGENREKFFVAKLVCPRVRTRADLLQALLFEIKRPFRSTSETELRLCLYDFIKNNDACAKGMLLLVDEAHLLSLGHLDELKQMTNVVRERKPGVRLVLCGGFALEERLNHVKMESFNQRVTGRFFLNSLTRDETYFFVISQMQLCGRDGREVLEPAALDAVHKISEGLPRIINQLCNHALFDAAHDGKQTITADLVRRTWAEIQCIPYTPAESSIPQPSQISPVLEFGTLEPEARSMNPSTETRVTPSQASAAHLNHDAPRRHEDTPLIDLSHAEVLTDPTSNLRSASKVDRLMNELTSLESGSHSSNLCHDRSQDDSGIDESCLDAWQDQIQPGVVTKESIISWGELEYPIQLAQQPIVDVGSPINMEQENDTTPVEGSRYEEHLSPYQYESSLPAEPETAPIRASNPFADEDFPEEETVQDPFPKLISKQNQASSVLEKADVEVLQTQGVDTPSDRSSIEFVKSPVGAHAVATDRLGASNTHPGNTGDAANRLGTTKVANATPSANRQSSELPGPASPPNFQISSVPHGSAHDGTKSEPERLAVEYPIELHPAYQKPLTDGQTERQAANPATANDHAKHDDDRDMIVISRLENIPRETKPEPKETAFHPTSEGRVVRVELRELFQQLRSFDGED